MSENTLYNELGRPVSASAHPADRGRTERTTAKETIDNDRGHLTLYAALSGDATEPGDRGRTMETKAGGETVDRDRHGPNNFSALLGDGGDLYAALASPTAAKGSDRGRTAITESTETMDWDRPPIGPRS